MFDEAVIYFGIEIMNMFEGKNNRTKDGKYIRELKDFLRENTKRSNNARSKLSEIKAHYTSLSGAERVTGIVIEYAE